MKLNEPLETSFEFDGQIVTIDYSFDVVLDAFEVLEDDVMNDIEKLQVAIEIMTGQVIEDPEIIVRLWDHIDKTFIRTKVEPVAYDRHGNPMPVAVDEEDNIQVIDFEVDAQEIYASFRQAYGINLLEEQGHLSWPEFVALLNGLPEETVLMKIIRIRNWKPSGNESSEYKSKMRKLQRKYRLGREEGE